MKRLVYILLIILFSLIFLASALYLGNYLWESHKQQSLYNDLANIVSSAQESRPAPSAPGGETGPSDETVPEVTEPPLVEVENPDTGETVWVLREYAEIYRMNSDLVGWLRISDTKINYPVVQTPNMVDYYLHRNFYREYSGPGCLYAREVCDVAAPSDNITIYGHCMRDGTMFGQLDKFKSKSFWEEHQTFTFDTIAEHHTYQIVSVFLTTATLGQGFSYHQFVDAASQAEFDSFVSTCKSLQLYDTGVTASYGDKLICLSTCEYSQENGRLVVMAKRMD